MLKKILLVLSVSIFTVLGIEAQNGTVSGSIVDATSKENIPFATLVLKSSKTTKGVSSDFDGNFIFEKIPAGNYQLKISYIGFTDKVIENINVSKNKPTISLGKILLAVGTEALKEVEITGVNKTQVTKIDRKSYKASDFATAKGGTASDVLNKLPSVNVASDGKVSVRGTEDFMVYLNGKPTNIEPSVLLAQIASNNIDKVDIISVPTARYDAQGKGGIVNITTKKNVASGLSVSVNGLLGGAPWNNLTDVYSKHDLKDDRYGGGFNLSYGTENVVLYGGFNYNMKNVNGRRSGEARVLTTPGIGEFFHMNAKNGERPEWYENYSANAGIDFNLSDTKQLSLSYFYGNRNEGRAAYYIYNTFFATADQSGKHTERFMYNPNVDNRDGKYNTFNVDYTSKLENNATFKMAAAYETSKLSRELNNKNYFYTSREDVDNDVVNNYANAYQANDYSLSDETPLKGARFATDYEKEFDNGNSFGTGLQVQYTNIDGDFKFNNDLVTKDLDNSIDLTRTVYAAYVDYSGKAGDLSYIFGVRAEYQDQSMDIARTDYVPIFGSNLQSNYSQNDFDLFPSAHLSYKLNDNNKLTLAGSRRINRASVTKLAPFLYRRHFEVYVVGDPELEAEYLNNVELSFNKSVGKHTFNLTGFYRGTDNTVFRVNTVTTQVENAPLYNILGEDVLIRSYTNAGNSTSLGAEFDANIMVNSFAKLFVGASLYNYQIDGEVFGYDVDQNSTNWSVKGNVVFTLSDEFKFNYDFSRKSNTVTSQGQNDAFSVSNVALNYQPKDAKEWNFSFRGLDIFAQNDQGLDTNAFNAVNDQIFYQETLYERMGPVFELGVTYSFNAKGKKKKSKSFQANKHFK
ncbi:Outer membrane receptor proteins, mostly Fe transport [Lutibacter oricola]|uniref:Outer membrane receptor proteins, mostly Fe transport n=1 Tax=Lutibacter oricola TaxID=762486 RepID=A0A1H2QPD8_9FLAO|nr:TonB-dependent receptor [Lutibacter oricola]SDW08955.1 Outer membrane receptor proteins, mostly Fe transport [Lutibacter oricola]